MRDMYKAQNARHHAWFNDGSYLEDLINGGKFGAILENRIGAYSESMPTVFQPVVSATQIDEAKKLARAVINQILQREAHCRVCGKTFLAGTGREDRIVAHYEEHRVSTDAASRCIAGCGLYWKHMSNSTKWNHILDNHSAGDRGTQTSPTPAARAQAQAPAVPYPFTKKTVTCPGGCKRKLGHDTEYFGLTEHVRAHLEKCSRNNKGQAVDPKTGLTKAQSK